MSQFDHRIRVVSLANLHAMCARVSGTCHTFTVDDPAVHPAPSGDALSVRVTYSNPTEYGTPEPISIVFPVVYIYGPDSPAVILEGIDWLDDYIDPDDVGLDGMFQAFWTVTACPQLFASTPDASDWMTREEWDTEKERTA